MKAKIQNAILNSFAWLFVALGFIGVFLPLLPTTPFLILALFIFAKSSPRFHQMLLDNRWFGENLRQWENNKSISRVAKKKATFAIVLTFSISIGILHERIELQVLLLVLATILLAYIWRIKESDSVQE